MPRWGEVIWLDGQPVFIDGHGQRPKAPKCRFCKRRSTLLCDFPTAPGKTCDTPLCDGCANRLRYGRDFCPDHDWRLAYAKP